MPSAAAGLGMSVGAAVLFGWRLGVTELIRVRPGLAAMRPSAAAGFMLAGLALWLLRGGRERGWERGLGVFFAGLVFALGGSTLTLGNRVGPLPLDALLSTPRLTETPMAEMSAGSFVLLGGALLLLASRHPVAERLTAFLTVALSAVSLLTLIGYAYGVHALYAVAWFRSEALHASVLFLVLAAGIACARPDTGVVRLLRSDTHGGEVARRILPPVVVLPIALGWGVLRGAQLRGYEFEFGIALYTLLIIGVLATLVWGSARALAEADASRLAAEEALRRQEEQHRKDARFFHSVLDSLPDGVTATDMEGRLILWNLAGDSIVRLAPAGATVPERIAAYQAVHRDGSTPIRPEEFPMSRALAGETVAAFEVLIRSASPPAWLSISASPLRGSDGSVVGAVGVFRDISERRALEAQLFVADRLASVGLLAAGVAHEINNPLAVMTGNLQLLGLQLADSPGMLRMVADAGAAGERIRQIVKDLRTVSGADSEKRVMVDVRAIVEASIRVAWSDIRHRARLVEDYEPVAGVLANEARLGQVFLNLVMNAAEAIPEGAADRHQVRARTRMGDGKVVVEISDTGVGIPPEQQARLFTPFFTTKPVGEGSGLGLSICHRLVAELGGEIQVESVPGKGSTFRVLLPAMPTLEGRVRSADARGRVLVLDDEPDIRELIRAALAATHEVRTCASGAEALELLGRDAAWGVLLVDLMMPGMTGMEFWRRLQTGWPELAGRVVFLSGGAFTAEAQRFLDASAARCLEKPFDLATLRATVSAPGLR